MGLLEKSNDLARELPEVRLVELVDFAEFLHDRVVGRPEADTRLVASERLNSLRHTAFIGDVTRPIGESWHAEQGRL